MSPQTGGPSRLRRGLLSTAILLTPTVFAPAAYACPVCHTQTGKHVRAGLFDENFAFNLFGSLLPFPIFLGIVAAILGRPARGGESRPTTDADASLNKSSREA